MGNEVDRKILVTGGSGYMGLHIIDQLLVKGYMVHATTRNLTNERSISLHALSTKYDGKLRLFEADLLVQGSFLKAMKDVDTVIHTASPIIYQSQNPYEEVVKPAVKGTKNVLETCLQVQTVKSIIVTSSVAAVISGSPDPNHIYNESDFNRVSTLDFETYYYSKVQAELSVYEFQKQHEGRFRIVTLAPCFCFGPNFKLNGEEEGFSIDDDSKNNSGLRIIKSWIKNGTENCLKSGVLAVDVRDVALAHVRAVELPHVQGRFLLINEPILWPKLKQLIVANTTLNLGDLQPDKCGRGDGTIPKFDNCKAIKTFGLNYKPIDTSIIETIYQLKEFRKTN